MQDTHHLIGSGRSGVAVSLIGRSEREAFLFIVALARDLIAACWLGRLAEGDAASAAQRELAEQLEASRRLAGELEQTAEKERHVNGRLEARDPTNMDYYQTRWP